MENQKQTIKMNSLEKDEQTYSLVKDEQINNLEKDLNSLYKVAVPDKDLNSLYKVDVPDKDLNSLYKVDVPDKDLNSLYKVDVPDKEKNYEDIDSDASYDSDINLINRAVREIYLWKNQAELDSNIVDELNKFTSFAKDFQDLIEKPVMLLRDDKILNRKLYKKLVEFNKFIYNSDFQVPCILIKKHKDKEEDDEDSIPDENVTT